jgi:proteasome lid subunit RPN8/RPN11
VPLVVDPSDLQALVDHAESAYPEECCGFLIGSGEAAQTTVRHLLPTPNERTDHRDRRYFIGPETVLAAHRDARHRGLEIVGFYHSHPDASPQPGTFDRENAWPGVSYLIIPVLRGAAGPPASWRLREDSSGFDLEPLQAAASRGENERG